MLLVLIAVKGDGGANFQINVSLTYLSQLRVMGWGGVILIGTMSQI